MTNPEKVDFLGEAKKYAVGFREKGFHNKIYLIESVLFTGIAIAEQLEKMNKISALSLQQHPRFVLNSDLAGILQKDK